MATNKVNTISFGPSQQDLQAQQIDLQRRQQIADALRAQSLAPLESQMVSGRVVPTSPWLGAIKLAQAAIANSSQGQNATDEAALGQEAAKRQAAALRALAPAGTFDEQMSGGLGMDAAMTDQRPQVDQGTRDRWAKILSANQYDSQLGRDLLKNELTLTDEQRNLLAQGIDPKAYGQARLAKEVAGGVTNVAAGTSVYNPSQGRFVASAPDFGSGIQGGFGPNGQPQVGRIAGSEVIPQMAGERARAEAAGRAGFNTITVNTTNGPVLMTEEQAAGLTGGAPPPERPVVPNMGFPPGANVPAPMPNAEGARLSILQGERQQIMARPDSDPRKQGDLAAITREIQAMSGGQRQAGIPLMSKAQEALQVGEAENTVALAKDLAMKAQSPEAQAAFSDLKSTIKLAERAEPLLEKATGSLVGTVRDKVLGAVGISSEASRAAAELNILGGELVGKVPRFSGPTSDSDRNFYVDMAGRVADSTRPVEDRKAALRQLKALAQDRIRTRQDSLPARAAEKVQNPSGASRSIDDLLNKYSGGR